MKNYLNIIFKMVLLAGALYLTSCKDDEVSPSVAQISPEAAAAKSLLTVKGSGLKDIMKITFENGNIPASFTSTFNTDGAILFRVPVDAVPGQQNIIFENAAGKTFTVPFTVLGLATINDVSDYNFKKDTEIILTGKNLDDVTKVTFTGTTTELEIVNKSATTLTVKFPEAAPTLYESTLTITNAAGSAPTTQSFVAINNALQIFTDDYGINPSGNAFQNASWGPSSISTTEFKSGTASLSFGYAKGNWSQDGFGWDNISNDGYKYLSFWLKGASKDYTLYVWSSAQPGTFNTFDDFKKILVPANVWTYYKLQVSSLKIFGENNTTPWNQIGWRIQGPDDQDETFYIDDVILVK